MGRIVESGCHPDSQRSTDPLGHALTSQVDGVHDSSDALARMVKPQNLRSLHVAPRGCTRVAQLLQPNELVGQQDQWGASRSSQHARA